MIQSLRQSSPDVAHSLSIIELLDRTVDSGQLTLVNDVGGCSAAGTTKTTQNWTSEQYKHAVYSDQYWVIQWSMLVR